MCRWSKTRWVNIYINHGSTVSFLLFPYILKRALVCNLGFCCGFVLLNLWFLSVSFIVSFGYCIICAFSITASDNPFWYFQTFAKPDLGNWRLHLLKRIALSISNRIYLQDTNYLLQDVHLYSEGLCWPYQYHLQTFWWMYKSSSNKSLL